VPLRIGKRVFAPSWLPAVVVVAAVAAFVALGRWQWDRGIERRAQWSGFSAPGPALAAGSRDLGALPRFQRVTLTGRYDAARQFVLDNRSRAGRPGYEVLTPFRLEDGRTVLVNRGWLPFSGYRDRLPDVGLESEPTITISGRLDALPVAGLAAGRAAPGAGDDWPKLVSFPTLEELAAALGRKLEPRVVLLDEEAAHGYTRDWRPPGIEPGRHFSYAVQWWSFAALAVVLWMVMSFRQEKR